MGSVFTSCRHQLGVFWTSLTHYAYLAMRVVGLQRPVVVAMCLHLGGKMQRSGLWGTGKADLFAGPHGEYPSALAEFLVFQQSSELEVFRQNGFQVIRTVQGIFYTGYSVAPALSIGVRQKLAKIIGVVNLHICITKNLRLPDESLSWCENSIKVGRNDS